MGHTWRMADLIHSCDCGAKIIFSHKTLVPHIKDKPYNSISEAVAACGECPLGLPERPPTGEEARKEIWKSLPDKTNRHEDPPAQSLRYNKGKAILSRVLCFGPALAMVAHVTDYGEIKYEAYNFTKGAPFSESLDCALRHLLMLWLGEDRDKESTLHHLGHFCWNSLRAATEFLLRPPGFVDDRPPPLSKEQLDTLRAFLIGGGQ